MIPDIGQFVLILALAVALMQSVLPIVGAARGNYALMAIARPAARAQFALVLIAFLCLIYAFVSNDFSVLYVATNSNSLLPVQYKVAAVWGGHEGSILLWLLMLTFWMAAVSLFAGRLPDPLVARILAVMAMISCGFLLFLLLTSNPFDRIFPVPADGRDLNPLLQDPGMVGHPPMLYMGYVGFSVAFSFAIAALIGGNLDAVWARWTRPWTIIAWSFLTTGICMGSAWAYYTLGWGGWWFWDPVENASFMPWLVGTALMHSLAVTEKRGAFKVWTVLMAIFAFSLSLLGTFLVRSGVLTSVHAFATDPKRGVFILLFLAIVIGGSLTLFAFRAPKVGLGGRFSLISRETLLLGNNVVLIAAAAAVMLGTLYPLFLDSLNLAKLSVGPPYFNPVFAALMTPAIFMMGLGPLAKWRQVDVPDLGRQLKWAFAISVVLALVLPLTAPHWSWLTSFGLFLAAWVVTAMLATLWSRIGPRLRWSAVWENARMQPRSFYGMTLAHCGVAAFIVGVTMVKSYEVENDVRMGPGDTTTVGPYMFKFVGVTNGAGPNYTYTRGQIAVYKNGNFERDLLPEKRQYLVQQQPMTNAAIDSGFTRDLYVALGEPLENSDWAVRIYFKPFIDWIWGGCLLMALGGVLAMSDSRYRKALPEKARRMAGLSATPAGMSPVSAAIGGGNS